MASAWRHSGPAIYRVLENRDRYSDVVLLYGARSPDELLYTDELREWGARFDMTVLITVDSAEVRLDGVRRRGDEPDSAGAVRPRRDDSPWCADPK